MVLERKLSKLSSMKYSPWSLCLAFKIPISIFWLSSLEVTSVSAEANGQQVIWAEVTPVRLSPSADASCTKECLKLCPNSREVSLGFTFCGALLSIHPLHMQSLAAATDGWRADCSPPTAVPFSESPLLNAWLVVPNQDCQLEAAKLQGFPSTTNWVCHF